MKYILTLILLGTSGFAAGPAEETAIVSAARTIPSPKEFVDSLILPINPYTQQRIDIIKRTFYMRLDQFKIATMTQFLSDTMSEIMNVHADTFSHKGAIAIPDHSLIYKNYMRDTTMYLAEKLVLDPIKKDFLVLMNDLPKDSQSEFVKMIVAYPEKWHALWESTMDSYLTEYRARFYNLAIDSQNKIDIQRRLMGYE